MPNTLLVEYDELLKEAIHVDMDVGGIMIDNFEGIDVSTRTLCEDPRIV
jgi:hypothetical protein